MEQLVRVQKRNDDGTAQVLCIRQSACSGDCHQCSGCGAAKEAITLTAKNPIGAGPGDMVVVSSRSGPVLAAAAMFYMLPLALFFVGYLVGAQLWNKGGLTGVIAFAFGIAGAAVYDRLVVKKRNTEYTIVRYDHRNER